MLRVAILCYAALQLALAVLLVVVAHLALPGAIYLGVNGLVIIAALVFERRRYRPALTPAGQGVWEPTGERFVDTTTGQLMEVHYNPATGERDYRPVSAEHSRP